MDDLNEDLEPVADEVRVLNEKMDDVDIDNVDIDILSNGDLAVVIDGKTPHYVRDVAEAQDYLEVYFGVEL